jgi:PAS domain S-box-containing protein
VFEDIVETAREPLLVLDSDLRVLLANRSFYDSFKVTPEETIGKLIYDLGNRQWDIPKLRTLLEEILPKDNKFDDYEVEHVFSSIGHKIMLLNARRITQKENISQMILLAIEDITEKMRLQRELAERTRDAEKAQFEAEAATRANEDIIETVREPLLVLDSDLRVLKANLSFYDSFQVTPEETIGKLIYDLGNRQWDIPKLRELLETILPQKATFDDYEVEHDFADIGKRIMLLNARQIQRGSEQERIILLAIEDITERKEIEDGLEKARKELAATKISEDAAHEYSESIINTVREPLIALNQDLRVVSASRSFYEVFKVNPKETVGQLIYDLGNKQWDIPKLRELLETILPQKATFDNYEVEHDFAGIGRRIMLLNARQIQRVSGKERIILLAIEDITEQTRLQRELAERTRDAEAANRAKSVFLANMSHEIRTPMTAILGFSQLMQRDPAATSEQLKHLDVINRSGEHLLTIINDILEISKIEAGRTILNPTTFDLHALVNDLETIFRVHTDAKKLRLIVERVGEMPRYVVADEAKVRQMLSNLLGNAVKFTQTGGIALRVRTSPGQAAGLRLVAEVEDTGQGISQKDIAGLFQRFEQTESGQKIRTGTGLGLAISRGFARLMGGDITVSSQEGKGSIFHVEIGLIAGDVSGVAKKAADSRRVVGIEPGQPKYRVLIADDNKENRDLLAQTLGPIGFELLQVNDGAEAIREFQAWQPDIILMDLRMPVMDGREATRRIKSTPKGKETAIIALTASSFEDGRKDMAAIGTDGYIRKPFRESELFETIARCLGVKYIYAEGAADPLPRQSAATATLSAEAMSRLPGDLVQGIRDTASGANLKALLTLIGQLETHDAQVAEGLRELANHYDYEAILRFFLGDPA